MRAGRAHRAVNVRADVAERHGAVGFAMKVVEAAHRLVLAGRGAQYADACFDRCGARVVELETAEVAGQDLWQSRSIRPHTEQRELPILGEVAILTR